MDVQQLLDHVVDIGEVAGPHDAGGHAALAGALAGHEDAVAGSVRIEAEVLVEGVGVAEGGVDGAHARLVSQVWVGVLQGLEGLGHGGGEQLGVVQRAQPADLLS